MRRRCSPARICSADATLARGHAVYCPDVADGLHDWLVSRLAA
jgi:hypothetical protein